MSVPLVSIAIGSYNRANLISKTIESLLRQSETDFELIVSDDASTDGTVELCERYAATDSRIRVHRNPVNLGLARNCSQVLRMTRGEFVVLAGDDDVYEPEFLRRLIDVLRQYPQASLAASRVDIIGSKGAYISEYPPTYPSTPAPSRLCGANTMLWKGFGVLMTGMYRRTNMMKTGLYEAVYRNYWDSVDLVFLFDMALHGDLLWLDEVLVHKRAGGVSSKAQQRSLFASMFTHFAIWSAYQRRVTRSSLTPPHKVLLSVSVAVHMIARIWMQRMTTVYTLATKLDPQRKVLGKLRRFVPEHLRPWEREQ